MRYSARTAVRWVILAAAVLMAVFVLGTSIYSAGWLDGAPAADAEAQPHPLLTPCCYAGAILLGGLVLFRLVGSYPRIGALTLALGVVATLLVGTPHISAFLESDSCLDSGGRWNYAEYRCER